MGFFSRLTRKKSAHDSAGESLAELKSRFRGVQLNPNSDNCCAAILATEGQRFLSHEVPMLPLSDCDSNDCRCTYQLYNDRRTGLRRTADVAFDFVSQFRLRERRGIKATGRRGDDE